MRTSCCSSWASHDFTSSTSSWLKETFNAMRDRNSFPGIICDSSRIFSIEEYTVNVLFHTIKLSATLSECFHGEYKLGPDETAVTAYAVSIFLLCLCPRLRGRPDQHLDESPTRWALYGALHC